MVATACLAALVGLLQPKLTALIVPLNRAREELLISVQQEHWPELCNGLAQFVICPVHA